MRKQFILPVILIYILALTGCANRPDTLTNDNQTIISDQYDVSGNKNNTSSEHPDYFYGEGRRVVIYYYQTPAMTSNFEITADAISTEGFRDFELSILLSENSDRPTKTIIREGLYYYGISDIIISVDDQTMSLAEALESKKVTLNALLARANQDVRNGIATELSYDDGGSRDMDINIGLQFHSRF